jgi:hypothetical protein
VPTAENEIFELYTGFFYTSDGGVPRRQTTALELDYGVSDWQEITFELPYLSQQRHEGLGDVVVGTKYDFVQDRSWVPGIAVVFELKPPTASVSRGLGSGSFDYDFRLPVQKTWGPYTALGNVGYTIIGQPKSGEPVRNVWFVSRLPVGTLTQKRRKLSGAWRWSASEAVAVAYPRGHGSLHEVREGRGSHDGRPRFFPVPVFDFHAFLKVGT